MAGPLSRKSYRPPGAASVADLRHRVTIQRLDESTRDAAHQIVPSWVDVVTAWARVEPVTGREFFQAGQVQANVTHRVVLRFRTDVTLTPKHRFVWVTNANVVLNVVAVLPTLGMANRLEVMCLKEE